MFGEHSASGLEGFSRSIGLCFLGQLSKPGLEGETFQCRYRFERRRLVVRKFNRSHGRFPGWVVLSSD
jgi:hypothetical protein